MKTLKPYKLFPLIIFSLINDSANAQYLPENAEYWWFYSEDGVAHYILEIGNQTEPQNTFIVLHGGYGGDHSYLINLVKPHAANSRFILYDQRGSLRSEAPDSTITYANFVNDLDALRVELGLEAVTLIAHSNGAMIALDYLGMHPDRVDQMILIGPPLSFIHSDVFGSEDLEKAITHYRTASESLSNNISEKIENKHIELGLIETETLTGRERTWRGKIEFAGWNVVDINLWPDMQNAFFSRRVFEMLNENITSKIWRERSLRQSKALAEATTPIHVIIGEHDFVDPGGGVWEILIRDTQNGTLTIIKDAAHMPWLDRPDKMKNLLK